jgi:hypothetical protein
MITNRNHTSTPSRLRAAICLFLFVAASVAVVGAIGFSRASGQGGSTSPKDDAKRVADSSAVALAKAEGANKIAPWVIEHTANGWLAEFFVVLQDQADLS